ncbi:MAG TPA: alpha/beta fold hydrolase [Polyangiales bacterium]
MRYSFGRFELDLAQRELRCDGAARPISPQVFGFISYLIANRERAVSKSELLGALWGETVVSEGSLQRVASLARSALEDAKHQCIHTLSGHGYRWLAAVTEQASAPVPDAAPAAPVWEPRYAQSGALHIAYCTLGRGELDLVIVLGWAFPMQALFTLPSASAALRELSQLARVICFDKRGTGLSDRVKSLPALDERMDDLRAVLDAAQSERAILLGVSEGGPLSLAFAQAHPERVAGLVLVGSFPRMASAPDYAHGWQRSDLSRLRSYVKQSWGAGATLLSLLPEAEQQSSKRWASEAERAGASPGAALELLEMNLAIDVRDRLSSIRVPTLLLQAREDRVSAPGNAHYLAEHIPGARLVEVDGDDHAFLYSGRARLLEAVKELLASELSRPRSS